MKEIISTKDNFEEVVTNSKETVLIDFYADWCGPCKMLAPIIEEIANEREDIKVCKINVDNEPMLAGMFNVSSIPMLAVVKDKKVTNTAVGYMSKEKVLELL